MRSGGAPTVDVVGRSTELENVRRGLDAGDVVTIEGPVGIGKTTLGRAVTTDRPSCWVTCLFGLALRPAGVLRGQVGNVPPGDHPGLIAEWLVGRVGDRTLVVDDVQFADACSLRVFELASAQVASLFILRTGEPMSQPILERMRKLPGGRVVTLGCLSVDDCVELAQRAGASKADAVVAARASHGHPLWAKHVIGSADAASVSRTVAGVVDRLGAPERTVLAALGLLGRPAAASLLGPGVQPALEGGFVVLDDGVVSLVHPMYGEVAAARATPSDRMELHRALGRLVDDPAEAARHLAAGGDLVEAAAAARHASTTAATPVELAGLLGLLASCTAAAEDHVVAASAALAAGDPESAIRWIEQIDERSLHFAAGAAVAARAARTLGDHGAATWAKRGLTALDGELGATWRQLRIEALIARSHDGASAAELVEDCAQTPEEPMARLAVALQRLAEHLPGWETSLDQAIECAERTADISSELEGRWVLTRAHAATGDIAAALVSARLGSARATVLEVPRWVERFEAERSWLRAICDPRATASGHDEAILALGLGDAGQFDEARALLGRTSEPGPRQLAVSSSVAWWDHDDVVAGEHARSALDGSTDPVVVLLAGPAAVWTRTQTTARWPRCLVLEADAVSRRAAGSTRAVDLFEGAASAWMDVSPRSAVRCAWAAAESAVTIDDHRAPGLLCDAAAAIDEHGVHAMDGRLRSVALAAGVRSARAPRSDGRSPVTIREREVLTHVAAGLTNRQIGLRLGISVATVNAHVRSSIAKLGAANRRQAAAHVVGENAGALDADRS